MNYDVKRLPYEIKLWCFILYTVMRFPKKTMRKISNQHFQLGYHAMAWCIQDSSSIWFRKKSHVVISSIISLFVVVGMISVTISDFYDCMIIKKQNVISYTSTSIMPEPPNHQVSSNNQSLSVYSFSNNE